MLCITNATVFFASGPARADVLIDEDLGTIANIAEPGKLDTGNTIHAAGKWLIPGGVDPHVHVYLPFMGTYAKDTWESVSKAALAGGTTSLIEIICPGKSDDPLEAYELWESKARNISYCDYGFHMGVTRFDDRVADQLTEIVTKHNCRSFKVFLAYKGALGIDDRELYGVLTLAKQLNIPVTAHCENETIIDELQRGLIARGCTAPRYHEPSRPASVEAAGVVHLCTFAELTGARVYIVHTSCPEAVGAAETFRERGVDVTLEVVLPHLVFDEERTHGTPEDHFAGAKYVMSPPLRSKDRVQEMWNLLKQSKLSTVATDHAPFDYVGQKEMGRGDFRKIPNGIPSVQHRVEVLHHFGVQSGRLTPSQFISFTSANAAEYFGLIGKGSISPGAHADLVLWDPKYEHTLSAKTHAMRTDYSAFEGMKISGRADTVLLRGKVMVREGKFVAASAQGKQIARR